MGHLIRYWTKRALAHSWHLRPRVRDPGRFAVRCPILCYHSVCDEPDAHADPVATATFALHAEYLAAECEVIALADLVDALTHSRRLPDNSVVITFDDGYVDNYLNALPILRRHSLPATFFLVTGFIDGSVDLIGRNQWRAMSWEQAAELAHDPLMTIGAHGVTHRKLSRLPQEEVAKEMEVSRRRIEEMTGVRPALFAYPDGQGADISAEARDYTEALGFRAACSTFWRTTHEPKDLYLLNRVMVSGSDGIDEVRLKVAGAYDYLYFVHKARALASIVAGGNGLW